ncbi:MAG: hypothetical protein SGILL_006860, partial [Bacillariaceae sp.]
KAVQEKKAQSLSDMTYEVFMQSWYTEVVLLEALEEERFCVTDMVSRFLHERRHELNNMGAMGSKAEAYDVLMGNVTKVYDIFTDDWNNSARSSLQEHLGAIGFLESQLAAIGSRLISNANYRWSRDFPLRIRGIWPKRC